jgi:hypothetical protein
VGDRAAGAVARAPRNRRPSDVALVAVAAVVAGLAAVVAKSAPDVDNTVGEALDAVLGWAPYFWRLVFVLVLALALTVAVDVIVRRRWVLARDLLLAIVIVVAAGVLLEPHRHDEVGSGRSPRLLQLGFPELRLTAAVAILAVAGPELVRPVRLLASWLVALAALGAVVLGVGTMSQILGALAVGLGAAALVRLMFGSAAGMPSTERVRLALVSLGLVVDDLSVSQRQRIGAAEFIGHDSTGSPLKVRVLGRDAQDAQRLARRWRLLAYRDPPRSAPVGRLEQVEHEAVAILMAAQAGVSVPEVVTVGLSPEDDALLVVRQPDVAPLESAGPDQVGDDLLEDLWRQVERLHAAGISHGRLNASNVLVRRTSRCSSTCRRRHWRARVLARHGRGRAYGRVHRSRRPRASAGPGGRRRLDRRIGRACRTCSVRPDTAPRTSPRRTRSTSRSFGAPLRLRPAGRRPEVVSLYRVRPRTSS